MTNGSINATTGPYYIELSFAPSIELISIVRRFVGNFFELALASPETSARLAMAVHELLENAVKFSTDGDSTIRVDMTPAENLTLVKVTTKNRAREDDIRVLDETFGMMRAATDPMAFYMKLMERATRSERSQLGLGRVAAEAGMQMSYDRTDDDLITVHAVMKVEAEVRA
jgi:hypothetical protein